MGEGHTTPSGALADVLALDAKRLSSRRPASEPSQFTASARALAADLVTQLLTTEWTAELAARLMSAVVQSGIPETLDTFVFATSDPRLHELTLERALQAQLGALLVLAPVADTSLWILLPNGKLTCALQIGTGAATRQMREAASDLLRGLPPRAERALGRLHATPVEADGRARAALVVRSHPSRQEQAIAYAAEAARALRPLLDRHLLLERVAAQQGLLEAAERRIKRVGLDLHDGPLQRLSMLISELAQLRGQLPAHDERLRELEGLARSADEQVRELSSALHAVSAKGQLGASLRRQIVLFRRRSGIPLRLTIEGRPRRTTPSQRIAMSSVLQEALANVRKHSGATDAAVWLSYGDSAITLRITDNGRGFDAAVRAKASRNGRLGLIGMAERIRVLGGAFEIESRPGGPTVVSAVLPRFEPCGNGAA